MFLTTIPLSSRNNPRSVSVFRIILISESGLYALGGPALPGESIKYPIKFPSISINNLDLKLVISAIFNLHAF
jgi:hypothetical protein